MALSQQEIDLIVDSGHEIDRKFPGLRSSNFVEWSRKVSYLAHTKNELIGGKKAGSGNPRSKDTFGVLHSPVNILEGEALNVPFDAVSIVRDNHPINEWRPTPLLYEDLHTQYWIHPEKVDIGEVDVPPPPPNDNLKLKLFNILSDVENARNSLIEVLGDME